MKLLYQYDRSTDRSTTLQGREAFVRQIERFLRFPPTRLHDGAMALAVETDQVRPYNVYIGW